MADFEIIKAELERRAGQAFNLQEFCYPKQYLFANDKNPYAAAVTTRRSGKTTGVGALHIDTALKNPGSNSVYITTTRLNAKKLMWPILTEITQKYKIPATANIADLTITFPNKSMIYVDGVNDSRRIENFRGMKLVLCTLDEVQSMRAYIETLIDDILAPALLDTNGNMRVVGTPGPVPTGYFYKISQSKAWSQHFFSMFDNPFIKDPHKRLQIELERRGVDINHPSIRREYFGEWATDPDSLVIKYSDTLNHFDTIPNVGKPWQFVVGVDLGYHDSDAIAVIAFNDNHPTAFLVKELITSKQGITPLVEQLRNIVAQFNPNMIVMDTGGLGKKIAEEITKRFGIPISPAEKTRKIEFIELLNDALRTAKFMAPKTSQFAQDAKLLEWDRDVKDGQLEISENFHSDICDATLYAFREALHWTHQKAKALPRPGTQAFFDDIEQSIEDQLERELQTQKFYEKIYTDPFD